MTTTKPKLIDLGDKATKLETGKCQCGFRASARSVEALRAIFADHDAYIEAKEKAVNNVGKPF